MPKQNLSNYIKFFNQINDLEQKGLITSKQKHLLKVNLTTKEYQLNNLICTIYDEQDYQSAILQYLQTIEPQPKIRYQSSGENDSPIRQRRRGNSLSRVSQFNETKLIAQIDELNDQLMTLWQSDSQFYLNHEINEKLRKVGEFITKTATSTPSNSQKQVTNITDSNQVIENLQQLYRDMKQHFNDYLRCHILLMDDKLSTEHLNNVLRAFMKNLVDADEISFIYNNEIYTSENGQFNEINLTDQQQLEIQSILEGNVIEISQNYPEITQLFQTTKFKGNYLLKIQNSTCLFCFHSKGEHKMIIESFLSLCNEYQFFDEVNQLAQFLLETLKQARVQCFNPLQLSHMIQDIGIAFIRCSKYFFIHKSISILSERYKVCKDNTSFISMHPFVEFDFRDSLNLSIHICFDLNKKEDMNVYKQLNLSFNKYLKFIKQCYDRTTFYKFFVKSQDSLIFEFDKQGQITFVSQPITSKLAEEFNINFNPQFYNASYTSIFKNKNLIQHIENQLQDQNKWKLTDSNSTYEVFMKMEEKYFKGFFVIFQQGWFRYNQKSLDANQWQKLRKSFLQQETNQYLDKLEQKHPQLKNSVVQMFKPKATQKQSQFKNFSPSFSPRHLDQRNSLQESESIRLIPKTKGINHFYPDMITETCIENIDNFDFNILPYSADWLEKQKVVFSILRRNNFIEDYKISEDALCSFLCALEYKYNKRGNQFHNYDHGVTVMQCTHAISLEIMKTQYAHLLSQFTKFALILSGLCHDVSHTGRTNIFEINSLSNLAIRYHDRSVLEQHHAATSIKLLCAPATNIIPNFTSSEFREFRKLFISNILYTDITEHFNLMKNFEARIKELNFGTEDDIKLMTGMIIHTSDFTGGAKPFKLSREWSTRVNMEFQEQYSLEGKFGYPQLPYMKDLDQLPIMAKSEVGFFKFIVRPLWSIMSKFTEDRLQQSVDNLEQTIVEWEKLMIN
ncbi:unnamed protein product [Paramecium primaurelia]|uniref:Phosphodiesterase n=1 Tax=Paramecium primaurelia TaxID=5886 RepID=A0A8S1LXH2_PARPR|nr:unnamed protein product [Paramecium primaurelia]